MVDLLLGPGFSLNGQEVGHLCHICVYDNHDELRARRCGDMLPMCSA